MKRFNDSKITLLLLAFVAGLVLTIASAKADFIFDKPQNLGPVVNSASNDVTANISADGLELYFTSDRPSGVHDDDIWVAKRSSASDPWEPPVKLVAPVNSMYREVYPSISSDGLTLYFSDFWYTQRPGSLGAADLWMATRASRNDPWTTPVNMGAPINSPAIDGGPSISHDNLTLMFASNRGGGSGNADLWMCTRATTHDQWGSPINIGSSVNTGSEEIECHLSPNGLALLFSSDRAGFGGYDLWMTTRKTPSDPWGKPVNLGATINTGGSEYAPALSPDMRTLYFSSWELAGGQGGYDLWQSTIVPIIDFNGDGIVNMKDFSKLAQYWQQNERSVDIAPPIGNGIVDVHDVAVFAENWLEGAGPIAHWKLDETEGTIAHDSADDHDGILHGDRVWQPEGGKIGGALQLDGADDYISTPFFLDPATGAFSIFAWVKGGAPGQVIVSQVDGMNWLLADPSDGNLMTSLSAPAGRSLPKPLASESVITDGQWHRVGFVWDGKNRILYVDDVEVARDTQASLAASQGGLSIGAGEGLEAGSFWSGLIDDVRIYDRAVTP
jgi:hypothetical protein